MKKAIVYYTDNSAPRNLLKTVRRILIKSAGNIPIIWVSQKPIAEEPNIVLSGIGRSHHSRCLQILTGTRRADADVIFFAENDVIYHPSHFEFEPPDKDIFFYNLNRWWLRTSDGQASYKEGRGSLSQLVAYKELIEDFFTRRVFFYAQGKRIKCGTEPGKHNCKEMPPYKIGYFYSNFPSVDIRHEHNFTKSDKFKTGYILRDEIPGWGKTKGRYKEFLRDIKNGNYISG